MKRHPATHTVVLHCIRAHLERMTFHDSFLQAAKQEDCRTPWNGNGYGGGWGQALLDLQVQMVTLTLQCDTYFSVIVPSAPDSGKSFSSSLSVLSTCRNSRTERGGRAKKHTFHKLTKIALTEIHSFWVPWRHGLLVSLEQSLIVKNITPRLYAVTELALQTRAGYRQCLTTGLH